MPLTNTVSITRTLVSGSPAALNANDGTTYILRAWSPGPRQWQHKIAESDWTHGQGRHSSKLAEAERMLTFRVKGSTVTNIDTAVQVLVVALSQRTYTVSGTIGGKAFSWADCGPADMETVNVFEAEGVSPDDLLAGEMDLRFTFPSSPVTSSGFW
jgi:hypothetical protein